MSLSAEQIAARAGKLTASRIAVLMNGDADGIMRLYREMIGEAEPENLDHIWAVRLGAATEHLNLDWWEQRNGHLIVRRGEVVTHNNGWSACTLDGWICDPFDVPFEAKHVGGREPYEIIVERYQPQLQWVMFVTGAEECALSVIMGASEPIVEFIERDNDYIAEEVTRGKQFMGFVARREHPVALSPVPAPADATKLYDMSGNNQWAVEAAKWRASKELADQNKASEKILKAAVPDDAKKCFGHHVQITRDRAGRLSLREMT